MSLDIYISSRESTDEKCICTCGHEHTVTRHEEHFWRNITHNVNGYISAHDSEAYRRLWGHEKSEFPSDLIPSLTRAVSSMKADPSKGADKLPSNGWGTAGGALAFCEAVLDACHSWPDAEIYISA